MSPDISEPQEWTAEGLLDEIQKLDQEMKDRSLTFILGAGASVTSGIPAGGSLAQAWLKEIHLRQCLRKDEDLEKWAAEKLQIPGFRISDAGTYYSRIFELRFGGDPKSGYAALEAAMEKAEPGLGYSILARVLADTRHKVVVTTNFDNLVADALAIHALQHPLIVGHESLTGFIRPQIPRPLVAKIHRDLHLHPKNDPDGVDRLEQGWEEALKDLFQHYTPLVIGYGGNDGSLMGFLSGLPSGHIPGRLFWCYREGTRPGEEILKTDALHNGVLVAIAGFDEFMVQLAQKLFERFELAHISQGIEKLAKQRIERYQEQEKELLEKLAKSDGNLHSPAADEARRAIATASKDEDKWWTWELRAQAESDLDKREAIYREAISRLPQSPELAGSYANFLADRRKDVAEAMYKKALELDPSNISNIGNYANFLADRRNDYDAAEAMYKKALELDPSDANITGNYAVFLAVQRKDQDAAEAMYKKALELNPSDVNATGNYANFLAEQSKDYDAAEAIYNKALKLDPSNARNTGNYAVFLADRRKDYDTAEAMYKKALDLAPSDATNTGNYALFMENRRKDYDAAEAIYTKALELDPNDANNISNYASFLADQRKDYGAAEALYKKALELDPSVADFAANYACLLMVRGTNADLKGAGVLVHRAARLSEGLPSQTLAEVLVYDCLLAELATGNPGSSVGRLKALLDISFTRRLWDFSPLFDSVLQKVAAERYAFYIALHEAILDADKVAALNEFELWRKTEPSDPYSLD